MAYQISVEEVLGQKKSKNETVAATVPMDLGRMVEIATNRGVRALELINDILKNANQLKGSGQSIAGAFKPAGTPELTEKQKQAEANLNEQSGNAKKDG